MKRLLIAGFIGLCSVAMSGCGGSHICDAYGGQANYSKYKAEHNAKVEVVQSLSETIK